MEPGAGSWLNGRHTTRRQPRTMLPHHSEGLPESRVDEPEVYNMNVLFIASVAIITADPPRSRKLFIEALGLPLEGEGEGEGDYSSGNIGGSNHFGIWPLSEAAEACFGTPEWPADRVLPQASMEFEVEETTAVHAAGGELQRSGYELLHPARTEPWG